MADQFKINPYVVRSAGTDVPPEEVQAGFNSLAQQTTAAFNATKSVPSGGTGQSSLTAHAVIVGEGTSPVGFAAPAAAGGMLLSTGATTDPAFGNNPLITAGTTNKSLSGQFYQNAGANVDRIADRLMIGNAVLNLGTNVATQPDWLTTYQIAKGRTYGFIQTSQLAVTNTSAAQDSLTTFVAGAQTAGRTTSQSQVIAMIGLGVNNLSGNTGSANNAAWGGYFEAFRDTTTNGNGGAYGVEIDTMNFTTATPVTDPYSQAPDQTIGLQMAAGGAFPAVGMFPTTVGINLQNNNSTFDKGIVFGSNSITGATGTSGAGIAIAMGFGHTIQWYGAAGTITSSILCGGTTTANGIQQKFQENEVQFNNASGKQILDVFGVANGVNGVQVLGAATGTAPQLVAVGSDANITLELTPKGTGTVFVNGPLRPTTTSGIVGTTTNDNVNAGGVGEYITANTLSVSLTNSVAASLTSIILTAGDWDVDGLVQFNPANTTAPTILECGVSTVNNTLPGFGGTNLLQLSFPTGGQQQVLVAPTTRVSIASTTTVYMVATAAFTVSTMTASGFIRARRVR